MLFPKETWTAFREGASILSYHMDRCPKNTKTRFSEFLLVAKAAIAGFGREFGELTSTP